MKLQMLYGDTVLLERVQIADTFLSRLRGLLGSAEPSPGEGLLIYPCYALHTFGMGYPIDVVFMSRNGVVLKIVQSLIPHSWTFARGGWQVLELRAGTLIDWDIRVRDRLSLEYSDEEI